MHLIIEGPDGGGKTTLAQQLIKQWGFEYHHEGPPPAGGLLLQHYAHLLTSRKRSTIFDRFHLGELVYGPLLRGSSGLSASDVTTLNGLLQSLGVLTILCRPSWPICKANSSTRKEYIEDEEYRRIAWERWGEVTLPPQSIVYDYTTGPLDLRAYLPRS